MAKCCSHFSCDFALIRYSFWHFALVWICMPVIDGLLFGNSNHPGVHKGSARANHRARPSPAPAQRSLNRKPAPDANPGGRWVFQLQHIALTRSRPLWTHSCLHNEPFSGPEGRGRGWYPGGGCVLVGAGTTLASGQKLYSTTDRQDPSHLRQLIVSTAMRENKVFTFLWKGTRVLNLQFIISSNLQSQITTCSTGRDTSKHLKTKYINPGLRRQWLNLDCKLWKAFFTCRTSWKPSMSSPQRHRSPEM